MEEQGGSVIAPRPGADGSPGCGETREVGSRPVFVIGCPRSGTTLLYHTILSSGNFAVFPLESHTFNVLGERFHDLRSMERRRKLLDVFVRTNNFAHTGLERADIENS